MRFSLVSGTNGIAEADLGPVLVVGTVPGRPLRRGERVDEHSVALTVAVLRAEVDGSHLFIPERAVDDSTSALDGCLEEGHHLSSFSVDLVELGNVHTSGEFGHGAQRRATATASMASTVWLVVPAPRHLSCRSRILRRGRCAQ